MGRTNSANQEAFSRYRLIPNFLVDTSIRDTSVTLFGKTYPSPLIAAPIGVQSLADERDAEAATCRACAEINIPFVLSTASSRSIEEIADKHSSAVLQSDTDNSKFASPDKWFQLYWPKKDEITVSLLNRAKANGFSALVVTLDTFLLGYRPSDLDTAFLPFIWGEGCAIGLTDPVFNKIYQEQMKRQGGSTIRQLGFWAALKILYRRSSGNWWLFLNSYFTVI